MGLPTERKPLVVKRLLVLLIPLVVALSACGEKKDVLSAPNGSGQAVTLTATVTGSAEPPTGAVSFFDNGNLIGQATLDSSGHASITVSTLSVGRHKLTAGYSGDKTFNPSISTARTQTVQS